MVITQVKFVITVNKLKNYILGSGGNSGSGQYANASSVSSCVGRILDLKSGTVKKEASQGSSAVLR